MPRPPSPSPGRPPGRARVASELLVIALYVAAAALVIARIQPPGVVPADAPPDRFSAERARVHLERITRAPHPAGSEANREVEVYLRGVLEALGLGVQTEAAPACVEIAGLRRCAHVRNVIATWPGRDHRDAILLSAHYDSVPNAPGAGDDGAAVAALLETARALTRGGPLAHDVIFAFVDAEEELLLGSAAFCRSAELERIRLVANFDARGSGGTVTLVGASAGSGPAIAELAGALEHPVLSSFYPSVARVLPNATDAEIYERCGLPTLSFAFAGGFQHYHQGTDVAANLDLRSLQHHGSHALALARRFGEVDLGALSERGELVFFDVARLFVVRYPVALARVLAAALGIATLSLLARRVRAGALRVRTLLFVAVAFAASLVGAVLIGGAVVAAVTRGWRFWSPYTHAAELAACAACLVLAAYVAALRWLSRRGRGPAESPAALAPGERDDGIAQALALGPLVVCVTLACATAALAPGMSHLTSWPAAALLATQVSRVRSAPRRALLEGVLVLPAVLLLTPVAYALVVVLGAPGAAAAMGCLGAVLGARLPALAELARRSRLAWALPLAAGAVLALILHVRVAAQLGPPVGNAISYAVDVAAKRALWMSQAAADDWTRQFLGAEPAIGRVAAFASDRALVTQAAPYQELEPPSVELVEDRWIGDERRLELHVRSPRAARSLFLWEETGVEFSAYRFEEQQPVPIVRFSPELDRQLLRWLSGSDDQGRWSIALFALPAEGSRLTLSTRHAGPIVLRSMDRSEGLARLPEGYTPRSREWTVGYPGDVTLVAGAPLHVAPP